MVPERSHGSFSDGGDAGRRGRPGAPLCLHEARIRTIVLKYKPCLSGSRIWHSACGEGRTWGPGHFARGTPCGFPSLAPRRCGDIPQRWVLRDAATPHSSGFRSRRRSARRRGLQYSFSLDGPIDSGSGHAEEVCQIGGRVIAGFQQRNQVSFLAMVEFRLLAPEVAFGLGHLHPLSRAQPDKVGFELRHHSQDIEEQSPDRIVGVVTEPPSLRLTCRTVSSSRSPAPRRERANPSSFVTTSVSPHGTRPGLPEGLDVDDWFR